MLTSNGIELLIEPLDPFPSGVRLEAVEFDRLDVHLIGSLIDDGLTTPIPQFFQIHHGKQWRSFLKDSNSENGFHE